MKHSTRLSSLEIKEVLVVFSDVSLETISELRSPGLRRIEERPFQSQLIGKGKF